jgi:tetratricopeptide (TPR) repeat protein
LNRGRIYINLKQYEKSLKDLNTAVDLNPENAVAYYYRGTVKFLTDNKIEACLDWEKAKELGNQDVQDLIIQNCK